MTPETQGTTTEPVDETAAVAAAIVAAAVPVEPPTDRGPKVSAGWSTGLRWLVAVLAGLILFSAFVLANGADPLQVYSDIWTATLTQSGQFQQIIMRAAPIALAGLAVVVPARAGLVNVGGEGQLIIGGIGAAAARAVARRR